MAKKKSTDYLYLLGMLVTAIGFLLPIFKLSAFGSNLVTINGFDIVGKGNSAVKIAVLLIFIGAVAGVLLSAALRNKAYNLVALIVSIAGGLYVFANSNDFGIKLAQKFLSVGFYLIIIGWIVAIIGWLFSSKR
ncbi:MAG: hypothetical protein LKF96_05970 [Treponema sp.]|jgi:hypothetical protein|nr:hypothetical protein [Treponema sp.]